MDRERKKRFSRCWGPSVNQATTENHRENVGEGANQWFRMTGQPEKRNQDILGGHWKTV